MRRRDVLLLMCSVAASALPRATRAQQPGQTRVVHTGCDVGALTDSC